MAAKQLQSGETVSQYLEGLEDGLLRLRANPRRRVKRSKKPQSLKVHGTSFVYAIRGFDRVKFGKADCPYARMAALQIGSPCDLSFIGYVWLDSDKVFSVESAVFELAEKLGIARRGEWLTIDDDMASCLIRLAMAEAGTSPIGVFGFSADEDYVSPYDRVKDWSTSGSFGIKHRP